MSKVINCECGEAVRAESEDELVEKVKDHFVAAHPEMAARISRDDILAMAEET